MKGVAALGTKVAELGEAAVSSLWDAGTVSADTVVAGLCVAALSSLCVVAVLSLCDTGAVSAVVEVT